MLCRTTSPPSFALEAFVHCDGETRFRRLCHPFLYSHSSSNVLEVEALLTNHLVLRGSYRTLTLVIYGNTAEDLGQFNIELADTSLGNLVSSTQEQEEGKLEDLPLALHSLNHTIHQTLSSLKILSPPLSFSDLPLHLRKLLHLIFKILDFPNTESSLDKVINALVSTASSYVRRDLISTNQDEQLPDEAVKEELLQLYQSLHHELDNELLDCSFLDSDADLPSSKQLVDMLSPYFCFNESSICVGNTNFSQMLTSSPFYSDILLYIYIFFSLDLKLYANCSSK
ncbi:hypothetical protein ACFE04_021076 [Oxalis oulophora]